MHVNLLSDCLCAKFIATNATKTGVGTAADCVHEYRRRCCGTSDQSSACHSGGQAGLLQGSVRGGGGGLGGGAYEWEWGRGGRGVAKEGGV